MGKIIGLIGICIAFYWFAFRTPDEGPEKGLIGTLTNAVKPRMSKPAEVPPSPPPAPAAPVATTPVVLPAATVTSAPSSSPVPSLGHTSRSGVPLPAGVPSHAIPGQLSMEVPPVWQTYAMRFRPVPPLEWLNQWERLGVQAVADPVTRTVSCRGLAGPVQAFTEALQAMDQVPGSCSVQAWTVYVDRRVEKGFDLVAALGAVVNSDDILRIGAGGLALDVSSQSVAAALRVIGGGGSVEVVQNPYVRLSHGDLAKVESTQEVPIPETVVSNGIAQTSIRFRKVGLQLEVMPTFYDMDRVRLGIVQNNGVVGSSVKVGGNEVPVIESQSVSSTADMKIGQTLVLGGVRTVRRVAKRQLFGGSAETSEGALYVVLSTFTDEPKAVPVDAPDQVFPSDLGPPPPLTESVEDGHDWIMGGLLPARRWEDEESDFVRAKGGK